MQLNVNNLVSISDANRNFSRVARTVDHDGAVVLLKNNVIRYVIMSYGEYQKIQAHQLMQNQD